MERVRYEIDPHNRLVIRKTAGKTSLPYFRKVVTGRFKIDKNNALTYHVKTPVPHGKTSPIR